VGRGGKKKKPTAASHKDSEKAFPSCIVLYLTLLPSARPQSGPGKQMPVSGPGDDRLPPDSDTKYLGAREREEICMKVLVHFWVIFIS